MKIANNKKTNRLEKCAIYKGKRYPDWRWDKEMVIFSPTRTRVINGYATEYINCSFIVSGHGKDKRIRTNRDFSINVAVKYGSFRKITLKEYVRLGNIFKKYGYRYNKRLGKISRVKT